ncbi:hypothetical protein [Aquimarina sediminis]|nr:hypothetical protein [Aquimarina sediminis]
MSREKGKGIYLPKNGSEVITVLVLEMKRSINTLKKASLFGSFF